MFRPYAELPTFDAFERVVDPAVFEALPDDWFIGMTDIVNSTNAIAEGRYKSVNMAGAAVISAMMNAVGHRDFPFIFGGDGASFAVAPAEADMARDAMAATARWVDDELSLSLRISLVPVAAVRAVGRDVRVARFAPSPSASYAMFSGGGLAWAEAQSKAGQFAIDMAPAGARPDLTGLSCRWEPMTSQRGTMLSLIVQRPDSAVPEAFATVIRQLLDTIADVEARAGHPVPQTGPAYRWPPAGLDLEARATRGTQSIRRRRFNLFMQTLLALVLFRTGWRLGKFVPADYIRQSGLNADYRKFDDGLRMTIDCGVATADQLQATLQAAERQGIVRFGLHRQSAALMTCIVPSIIANDHLHFIDGASGGYAVAASQLKNKLGQSTTA